MGRFQPLFNLFSSLPYFSYFLELYWYIVMLPGIFPLIPETIFLSVFLLFRLNYLYCSVFKFTEWLFPLSCSISYWAHSMRLGRDEMAVIFCNVKISIWSLIPSRKLFSLTLTAQVLMIISWSICIIATLKSLSDISNICILITLMSIDCLLPGELKYLWFFLCQVISDILWIILRDFNSYLNSMKNIGIFVLINSDHTS